MRKMEILAPAGSMEALTAAVRCGADAVYLGQKDFSARKNSQNFGEEELFASVSYAHLCGVKIHQALNILVFDRELERLKECIRLADRAGVDAFIVQDLGVARLAKEFAPHIPLHASTQMAIHSPDGVKLAKELGFSRVVLARELSMKEIAAIRESTDLELEVFVHGAHCMSVSGQCYFSAMLGGMSGNRGRCAQPCRLPFSACQKGEFALSLKDLSLLSRMEELASLGVESLKIEGRMKRPEYVASAVTACKQAMNGEIYDEKLLRSVFSRDGFTSGYFDGKLTPTMFGTRMKDDVVSAADAHKQIAQSYKNEVPRVPLQMQFTMEPGEPMRFTLSDGVNSVTVTGGLPVESMNSTTKEDAASKLTRLGGTPYYIETAEYQLAEGFMAPPSMLNAMRREAVEKLSALRTAIAPAFREVEFPALPKREKPTSSPSLWGKFRQASQLPKDLSLFEKVILPAEELLELPFNEKFLPSLPRFTFKNEGKLPALLSKLRQMGYTSCFAESGGGIISAKKAGFSEIHGGYFLNLSNSYSLNEGKKLGLSSAMVSAEGKIGDYTNLKTDLKLGYLAYGRFPLMAFRACPIKAQVGCKNCGKKGFLTDRKGVTFPVRCDDEVSYLYNSLPTYLGDKQQELTNFDYLLLEFTVESVEEAVSVTRRFALGEGPDFPFTRGLYRRGVE